MFKDVAKHWIKSLPPGTITTWDQLKRKFIEQFRPPSKTAKLKIKIINFQQLDVESLYEALNRYKMMLQNYPQHDLSVQQEI